MWYSQYLLHSTSITSTMHLGFASQNLCTKPNPGPGCQWLEGDWVTWRVVSQCAVSWDPGSCAHTDKHCTVIQDTAATHCSRPPADTQKILLLVQTLEVSSACIHEKLRSSHTNILNCSLSTVGLCYKVRLGHLYSEMRQHLFKCESI